MAQVALVFNPAAGSRWSSRASLESLRRALGEVELLPTRGPGDGFIQGRAAAEAAPVVAILGGDGTVHETLNGVVQAGAGSTVLLLPSGTANVLARDLKIPLDPLRAARLLKEGAPRAIHLGLASWPEAPGRPAGRRYFALMAGAGLDASIVYRMGFRQRAKRAVGRWAFVVEGLRHARRYPFPEIQATIPQPPIPIPRQWRAYFVVVGNSPGYAGWFSLTPDADPSAPGFQVALCTTNRVLRCFGCLGLALVGRLRRSRDFVFLPAERVLLASEEKVRVQMDGESAGFLPMEFWHDGTTVQVLTPRQRRTRRPAGPCPAAG